MFAYAHGAAACALGLLSAAWWDLPAGAVIVWAMAGLGIVLYASGPRRRA
jgi:zinc/manganese transport system permease protein